MSILSMLNSAGGKSEKMLYNITFKLDDDRTVLKPCVPYTAAEGEDKVTERVCLSDSVDGCLSAIGSCNRDLYEGCTIIVRSVPISSLDPNKIVTPEVLFESGKVPDALENQEYWYLGEVNVLSEKYCIESFEHEYSIAFTCLKREDVVRLIEKYNSPYLMRDDESIEQAYNRTMYLMQHDGRYNESDNFDEEVCELPWAQRIRIRKVVMTRV